MALVWHHLQPRHLQKTELLNFDGLKHYIVRFMVV